MAASKPMARSAVNPALLLDLLQPAGLIKPEVFELFDHLADVGFWMKDLKGRFLWVSVPWLVKLGLQASDRRTVIGKTDFDFFPDSLATQYQLDDESVKRGVPVIARIELVGRWDQPAIWNTTTKIPLRDARGKIVGTAGVGRAIAGRLPSVIENSPVSAAIAHISRNYGERISNAALARACGLSERVFQRKFNAIYHCSPRTYLRQIRVRLSCHALTSTDKKITDIALEYGFADQSHLTKEFHRIMGVTPRAYRVQNRSRPQERRSNGGSRAGRK